MQILQLLLLLGIFLGVLYCVRSLRAMHRKVSSGLERNSRELTTATKETKAQIWQSYRQTEAMLQLLTLLK